VHALMIGNNAHPECAEGVARITWETFRGLSSLMDVDLVSIIDPYFERTFNMKILENASDAIEMGHAHFLFKKSGLIGEKEVFMKIIEQIRKINKVHSIDIIHLHNLGPFSSLLIKTLVKKPILFQTYSLPRSLRSKMAIKVMDGITSLAPEMRNYIIANLHLNSNKVYLTHVPIDSSHFKPMNTADARKYFNLPPEKFIILYLGNPFIDRLPPQTFKIIKRIIEKGNRDILFLVAIPAYSTSTYIIQRFYENIRKFKLENNMKIIVRIIDYRFRPLIYNAANLIIHPYLWEEVPYPFLTVLEAMSCGKPVIVSAARCYTHIVIDAYNGFLFRPRKFNEFERKLLYVVANKGNLHTLGLNARDTITSFFSYEKVAKEIMTVYEDVLRK